MKKTCLLLVLLFLSHCIIHAQNNVALNLLNTLKKNGKEKNIVFGRHNEFFSGISNDGKSWSYTFKGICSLDTLNSDLYRMTKQYPGILSIDIGTEAINYNSKQKMESLKYCIQSYYRQVKGIVTVSCHLGNPWWYEEGKTGDPYRYKSKLHPDPVSDILQGKAILSNGQTVGRWYEDRVSRITNFFLSLHDDKGNLIPVIFRPFHEASHDAFWWGHSYCTNEEYKSLFRNLVDSVRKRCVNVLIAYSPDKNWNTLSVNDRYMDRYPGNNYVDILGLDSYGLNNEVQVNKCISQLRMLTEFASKNNKVVALTETGNQGLKAPFWFTRCLYKVLFAKGVNVSYALVWSSWSSKNGYFIPYNKKTDEAKDLKRFTKHVYLSKKIKKLKLTD